MEKSEGRSVSEGKEQRSESGRKEGARNERGRGARQSGREKETVDKRGRPLTSFLSLHFSLPLSFSTGNKCGGLPGPGSSMTCRKSLPFSSTAGPVACRRGLRLFESGPSSTLPPSSLPPHLTLLPELSDVHWAPNMKVSGIHRPAHRHSPGALPGPC